MKECSVDGCGKPRDSMGYCRTHYARWKKHGDPLVVLKPHGRRVTQQCSVDDCDRSADSRGMCGMHYQRWQKHGDPLILKLDRSKTVEARFWEKVDKDGPVPEQKPDLGPCWVWTGGLAEGYGVFHVGGRQVKAHVLSFTWAKGPIGSDQERDHLCRNRACVRPDHLEAATHRVNVARGVSPHGQNAIKTHCKHGHEFTPENTVKTPKGGRACRTCRNAHSMAYYNKCKAKAAAVR